MCATMPLAARDWQVMRAQLKRLSESLGDVDVALLSEKARATTRARTHSPPALP